MQRGRVSRRRGMEGEAVKERKRGLEGERWGDRGRGVGCWSAGAWLPSTGKKRRLRGSGALSLSLSLCLSLPLSPCLKTAGGGESPLQAEWWMVTTWGIVCVCVCVCVCVAVHGSGNEVRVQMRLFYYFTSVGGRKHFARRRRRAEKRTGRLHVRRSEVTSLAFIFLVFIIKRRFCRDNRSFSLFRSSQLTVSLFHWGSSLHPPLCVLHHFISLFPSRPRFYLFVVPLSLSLTAPQTTLYRMTAHCRFLSYIYIHSLVLFCNLITVGRETLCAGSQSIRGTWDPSNIFLHFYNSEQ